MVILQDHVNTTTIQQPGAQYLLITYIKYLYIFKITSISIDQIHLIVDEFLTSIVLNVKAEQETFFFFLHLTISGYKQ